jgi:hypothetical protein
MQPVDRRRAFRRTRRTAVGVGCVALLTFVATDPGAATPEAPAQAEFTPGTGNAIALAYKVNPAFGGLSFGITAGESVAGHQNTAATAQSKAVNLGVIGVTLAGEGCGGADATLPEEEQPQPLIVSSGEEGAAEGRQASEAEGAITMEAAASDAPFARAVTKVAPMGEPAIAVVTGGISTASSGVVEGGIREARAVSQIAELRLLGGAVILGDMRWEAIQRSGAVTEEIASFEIGSLTVGGEKIPLPTEQAAQIALLNDTLNAVGFQITVPKVRSEEGIVFVDPLKIGVIPSDLRDGLILGPVLSALQPVREAFTETLFRLGCGGDLSGVYTFPSSTAVTVLDLAIGSISGAGSLNLELGGVQATTAEIAGFAFPGGELPPLADLPATPALPVDSGAGFDAGGVEEVAAPPAADTPAAVDTPAATTTPVAPIADLTGERGGALLAVGAGGLLALLASAEVDRRKMRQAQRAIPVES